ncbi:MAG: SIS domain-containing protein [Planctomycetota bacterium]
MPNLLRLPRIRFCRPTSGLPKGTIVIFPVSRTRLCCGLAGIVEIVRDPVGKTPDVTPAGACVSALARHGLARHAEDVTDYAGGEEAIATIEDLVAELRRPGNFPTLCASEGLRENLSGLAKGISNFVTEEVRRLDAGEELPDLPAQEQVNRRLVRLKDAAWALERELLENVERVGALLGDREPTPKALREYRKLNVILNSLDRLEIRGRDSAGVLVQVTFPDAAAGEAARAPHGEALAGRTALEDLADGAVSVSADGRTTTFLYKVAAEVGKLGDNVAALRAKITADDLLADLLASADAQALVMSHTRWASNGIINVPNCHPLDNRCADEDAAPALDDARVPGIHVALNGDIDNYLALKERFEESTGRKVSGRITTDAKVIALWIDWYLRRGDDLETAFRRAVADFEGSAAISMTSDLEPGRLYLSLKGSGQSLYVGLPTDGYVVASEIYGLVEETDRFTKLEGERERVAGDATTRGQVFVLDPSAGTDIDGIRASYHDGVGADLGEEDVKRAEITTRDVDRGEFPHYFLKEVSQAADSVANTLRGKFSREGRILMGTETIPDAVARMLADRSVERVMVIGQGTAAIAAMAVAAFISHALKGAGIHVEAMKASELSGFWLEPDMSKTVVVAVTQSGATADTNRAVDLARERGALTLAIVNRRNSDITFKTAGVLYTSDGRDVEMSVASTKAFYSQVVAGAVLGLAFGRHAGTMAEARVLRELSALRELPGLLREVFAECGDTIRKAADELAPSRRYWTVVGSGPNRIAAEEVRIKLSELCYKSISADSVEDKKHIDLSSESLILVLAAGNNESVLADLAKDVAIFKAHRALPVVIAVKGDRRFDEYASAVIELPEASPLLSMVLCTMAGHLFGYHAARAIDEGGRFLGRLRSIVVGALDRPDAAFVRDLGKYGREYRERLRSSRFASALEADTATELMLLLKYAAGEIPPISFAEEFGREPGMAEINGTLLETLVGAIDQTGRPIDAIKHQAKIVTVGTSRPSERPTGILFDALDEAGVATSALTFADRALLTELTRAVGDVTGFTRYVVEGLPADGTPAPETMVTAVERKGSAASIESRAEGGSKLKGTKRTVVTDRRAFIGVGAKDGRKIAILPLVDHRFLVNALVLLHLEFREDMKVAEKVEALGDRYDDIVDGVTEADIPWSDDLLDAVPPEQLFTYLPREVAALIVAREVVG